MIVRRLLPLLTRLFIAVPALLQAQADAPPPRSSLDQRFVAIPGTPVLFAVHETRVSDWQAFLKESGYAWSYQPPFEQGPDHPVVGITLQDARAFCSWLTDKDRAAGRINRSQAYRLPSRDEWDAAVGLLRTRKTDLTVEDKVADERTFPWGAAWPPPAGTANLADGEVPGLNDGFRHTAPVGQFAASPEGLYDLAGNVWEWCWDPEVRAEQVGVLRGGSWAYFRPECLRSAYLYLVPVDLRMPTIGFRCVLEDKQRSAVFLAEAEKQRLKIREERRQEILGGPVSAAEMTAMKQRLAAEAAAPASPVRVQPASAGQPFTNALGLRFVPLPGRPQLIGTTEVRVQDYQAWLQDTRRTWTGKPAFLSSPSHPAVGVSWEEAGAFAAWLTERDLAAGSLPAGAAYRLPSDQEWSLAAGLSDEPGATPAARAQAAGKHYPWSAQGNFPPPAGTANLDATRIPGYHDSHAYTAPVEAEAATPAGVSGLGGNAAEWCQDAWDAGSSERVIRGGSWLGHDPQQLRTGARQKAAPDSRSSAVGFRLVVDFSAR